MTLSAQATPTTPVVAPTRLEFRGVSLRYPDGTHALEGIDLSVEEGEFVAIVGPSGCGKSTLLRIASGLIEPTAGEVQVERDALGYVFQDATLLPWRTVLGNASLLLELAGVPRAEREARASEALALVGLAGFASYHPRRLSGGMRMRVSLARSLALNPSVFLFDEPFGALDEITRERLNDELLALFLRQRFAGLFVTHSIYEAVYLATRVVVMSARPGRIVASFDVEAPYPRDAAYRYSARFASLAGMVSEALREASR